MEQGIGRLRRSFDLFALSGIEGSVF